MFGLSVKRSSTVRRVLSGTTVGAKVYERNQVYENFEINLEQELNN